jgi:hypothetical protein
LALHDEVGFEFKNLSYQLGQVEELTAPIRRLSNKVAETS